MEDQADRREDQYRSDDDCKEPEVPPRAASDNTNAHDPHKHANRAQHAIAVPCDWVKVSWFWSWCRIITSSNFWMAAATVAIAVATGIYTYYARQQWTAMNNTLSEIQRQTPEIQKQAKTAQDQLAQAKIDSTASSIATDKQIRTLQGQLTHQDIAMKLDQRAWVSLDHYELQPAFGVDKSKLGQAFAVLRNTGKTPALNVRIIHGAFSKDSGSPNDADDHWMDLITRKVDRGIIGPDGMGIAPRTRRLDQWGHDWYYKELKGMVLFDDKLAPLGIVGRQKSIVAPRKGTIGAIIPQADPLKVPVGLSFDTQEGTVMVIYGTVFYEDVFGKRHKTDFCGISHNGVPASAFGTYSIHGDWSEFTNCAVHNKMD